MTHVQNEYKHQRWNYLCGAARNSTGGIAYEVAAASQAALAVVECEDCRAMVDGRRGMDRSRSLTEPR